MSMPGPLADDFSVNAFHEEVTNVGMSQPMKRDRCHLCRGDKPTKCFAERIGIHRPTVGARKHKCTRIAPKPKLQPVFELGPVVLPQSFDCDGRQVIVRLLVFVFGDLNSNLPLMRSSD